MRICLISETLFPVSGTSSRTLNLAKALTQRGHNVWVITPKETPNAPLIEKYQGFYIRRLNAFIPQKYGVQRRNAYLRFLIKGGAAQVLSEILKVSSLVKVDVMHYVNYYMSLCGITFRKFMKNSVFDLQASAFLESQGTLNKALAMCIEKSICNNGTRIIVPTDELRAYLIRRYPQCENITDVIPLCINIGNFKNPANKNHIRKRLGLSEKDCILVFHGSPYKSNIDALKKLKFVVERLNARGLRVKVLVLGFIDRFVNSPYFLSQGYVKDLELFISAADLAVLPVNVPSLGMRTRILEYMACGVPVVTLSKGACGYHHALKERALLTARKIDDLIDISFYLLQDVYIRRVIAENAMNYIKKYHSYNAVATKLESVYKKIVKVSDVPDPN
jgi:glycosyltransferase involved in cell wall biosynthesis